MRVRSHIEEFDKNYSRFRNDSIVASIAHSAGTYEMPADFEPLNRLYRDLYERTGATIAAQGIEVAYGEFGAHMDVELVNDGPVTILLDSKRAF